MKSTLLKICIVAILTAALAWSAAAQSLTLTLAGPASVDVGDTQTYYPEFRNSSGQLVAPPAGTHQWFVDGGNIISQASTNIQIEWTTVGSTTIQFQYDTDVDSYWDNHIVTVNLAIPKPPINLAASGITTTSFTADWRNSWGADHYKIDVSAFSDFSSLVSGYNNLQVSGTSVAVTGLAANTTYYWRVRASNSMGTSASSAAGTVILLPTAPAATAATNITTTSFTANWQTVAGAMEYRLDVSDNSGFSSFVSGYNNIAVATNSKSIVDLPPDKNYYYRVRAVNTTGTSVSSNIISLPLLPQAPGALAATEITSNSFKANWYAVPNVTEYRLDVSTNKNFTSFVAGFQDLVVTSTSKMINNASRAIYYYRVRAVNASGTSVNSNIVAGYNFDHNYVKSVDVLIPDIKTQAQVDAATLSERSIQYGFFDGVGRASQTVQQQASPAGLDIVQPVVYDQFGREAIKYLPFTAENNGWFKDKIIDGTTRSYTGLAQSFYAASSDNKIADDARPYAEIFYEASPLNRASKQYGPGADWSVAGNDKYIKHNYHVNKHGTAAGQEKIIYWKIDASGMPVRMAPVAGLIETGGYYSSKQLNIKSTIDEQGNEVREYINNEGNTILKKVQAVAGATDLNNTSQWAMTYYVYDDFGNERYVLQPELGKIVHQNDTYNPTSADLNNWAFQKKYDTKRRVVEKRAPGADWVYIVYDKRDRLVMTQDGNQRNSTPKYWTFTKYDHLNRPVLTGIKDTAVTVTQAAMQTVVDNFYNKTWTKFFESYVGNAAGNVHGYTNKSYPVVTSANTLDVNHYISVNYYDDYNFRSLWAGSYAYVNDALAQTVGGVSYLQPAAEFLRTRGLATGSKVKVLDGGMRGGYVWLKSINYYDDKYRVVQIIADNYKGGTDRVTNLLDFAGKVLQNKTTHLTQDITWKNVVNVSVVGSKLTNIAGSGWGNAGAASQQVLNANTDGWIETTVPEITTARMFGLTTNDAGQGYANINYGFLIANPLQVYELGSPKYTDPVAPKPGDKLRIARVGTQVKYYKNDQLLYTSATSSSSSLTADLSFNNGGATFISGISSFSAKENTVLRELEYDHARRLLKTWHTYNNGQRVLISGNEYNELGQLVDKKLHSTNGTEFKQSLDYEYNIRGWLTKMNDSDLSSTDANALKDLFGFELGYNQSIGVGNTSLYNGNISAMKWSNNLGLSDNKQKAYLYSYDAMNRLTDASYKEATGAVPTWASVNGGAFAESGLTYDLNGNIKTLTRRGKDGTLIDNLTYDYGAGTSFHSNKLRKVTDAANDTKGFTEFNASGDDYVYDNNGSLLWDRNKGGQELLKNGEFTTGSTDWTVTDTGSRLTFANDRVEIASGSASSTIQQNNLLKAWSDYIVIIDMERTSGTANLTLTAGGTAVTVSNTGLSTFDMRTTSTKDFVVTIPAAFVGRINSIQVKGLMTISYNFLNLTERASRSSDQTINYIYDASGRKLCQMLSSNNAPVKKTDYAGEYFYENDTLKFINHEEGRVVIETNGTPTYQYHLKDHLDNVR
ncbi:MAG: DUF6443 domain-containing protein, partial [Bacteroidota bacterium]